MIFTRYVVEQIRDEFPRVVSDFTGRKRAFFDNGTGTLVVGRAAKAEATARLDCSANVGAGFDESQKADAVIRNGREAVADLLNASSPDTIVSGESTTSLLFNVSYAIGKALTGNENVVTTDYEHYANISPWVELERRRKLREVRFARLHKRDGTLDLDQLQSLIDEQTRVVTVTAASNVLGTKSPLEQIGKLAKDVDAYFVVDGVHHIAHGPIDVKALDCDFLVFSGYKLFSSHGSFLYGKPERLETLKPYKVASAPDSAPSKWEWGTRDQSMFAAIRGVVDHFVCLADQVQSQYGGRFTEYAGRKRSLKVALDAIEQYGRELSQATLAGFDGINGLGDLSKVNVYGLTDLTRVRDRDPTFAFKVKNMPDDTVVRRLWTDGGIATRAEDFYSRALESYNQQTMIRISLVHYNTFEEIGRFLKTLHKICEST